MKTQTKRMSTKTLALGAMLSALVVVLQMVAKVSSAFLPVTISLSLIPIVIGAATCHYGMGAWLGLVSAVVILLSGSAEPFFSFSPAATVLVVLAKAIASGLVSGLIYKWLSKKNSTIAIFTASIACPIINTGIFLLGCYLFFMELITSLAGGQDVAVFVITALIGWNFVFEFGTSLIFSPTIKKIIDIKNK